MAPMASLVDARAASLARLQNLRLIEIIGQLAVIGGAVLWLGMRLPLIPILAVVAGLALATLVSAWRLTRSKPVHDVELAAHLVLDILALALLLYFTGGATNPFVSFFLLPLSLAAAMLAAPLAWAMVVLTVAAYSLLMVFYVPLPGMSPELPTVVLLSGGHALHLHGNDRTAFALHLWGMWLNFVASAVLIVFFVQRIAAGRRAAEQALARAREEALRNERIVALGVLAASTAHELATPLSTLAVVTSELADRYANDPEIGQEASLMKTQVDRLRDVLARLRDAAIALPEEGLELVPLDDYLAQVIDRWRLVWPAVPLAFSPSGTNARILADQTLESALLNLLNNAARVSPEGIELHVRVEEEEAHLSILDHGPGPSPEVRARAGRQPLPGRSPDGLGIGLWLANASIERLGGRVELGRGDTGGVTDIVLPLGKP